MGNFVNVTSEGIKHYIGLTEKPFGKVLGIEKRLSLHRFSFKGKGKTQTVYFDTDGNLLEKAGIILSKTIDSSGAYFKVERKAFHKMSSYSRRREKVFIHKVGIKDQVMDHAFYLSDGIKSLFTTQFTIDLDNVLKNVFPKIVINSKITKYQVLSGGGFKAQLEFYSRKIKNLATKRVFEAKTLTVHMDSSKTYMPAFNYFNNQIEKFCKELVPFDESLYDYSHRVTKQLEDKAKISKEDKKALKAKQKKADDVIIG